MEYYGHENIAYCTVFDLKLSQDELEVYESCIRYVLEKCNETTIYSLTGCKMEEINAIHQDIRNLILTYVPNENLPDKYRI